MGGVVDLLTKRPSLDDFTTEVRVTLDTINNRRWMVDIGGPVIPGKLGLRISYSGEDSGSYFYGHYFHKSAVYAALRWRPNDNYQLDFNTEINVEEYTENVGVNRVNQQLIDHGTYLQGAPDGNQCFTTFFTNPTAPFCPSGASAGIPIGSPSNPYSPVLPILTEVMLTTPVQLNPKITIDQTPGTNARAVMFNVQAIQTLSLGGNLTLENNTFFNYLNSDNQDSYYFADNSNGSWTIENRTDLTGNFKFHLGSWGIGNQFVTGIDCRFAARQLHHRFQRRDGVCLRPDRQSGAVELQRRLSADLRRRLPLPVGVRSHSVWRSGRAIRPTASNTGISDLWDVGYFFQDRMELSRQFSFLFGGSHRRDPGSSPRIRCPASPPTSATARFRRNIPPASMVRNVNVSLVWRPQNWISTYLTFDWTQSLNPNGGVGGVNA